MSLTRDTALEALRYPIGRFNAPDSISSADIELWLEDIRLLPANMRTVLSGMTEAQLDTSYRQDGWTVRQLVHHVADSHINSYIRFRWTLTEDQPTIKAYEQTSWAELSDAKTAPVALSLNLLDALHARWLVLLQSLSGEDWKKFYIHPETGKSVPLDINLALYAWHGKHHVAHIVNLKDRMNW